MQNVTDYFPYEFLQKSLNHTILNIQHRHIIFCSHPWCSSCNIDDIALQYTAARCLLQIYGSSSGCLQFNDCFCFATHSETHSAAHSATNSATHSSTHSSTHSAVHSAAHSATQCSATQLTECMYPLHPSAQSQSSPEPQK